MKKPKEEKKSSLTVEIILKRSLVYVYKVKTEVQQTQILPKKNFGKSQFR